MRHTEPKKKSSARSSTMQAILLLVVLLVGYLGYGILKQSGGLTAGLSSFIDADIQDFRPLQVMAEERKLSFQREFGGFWVHETEDPTAPVRKYDCLELRDNGIIWQVVRWDIRYPDGDSSTYYHVRYGYLNPYSIAVDEKTVVCEVRTIRQVYIVDDDTCFGKSQVDELWNTRKEDSLLVMNRKRYRHYCGELVDFFPEGMIDLVDKLLINECSGNFDLAMAVKKRLSTWYQDDEESRTCDPEVISGVIDDYFVPAYLDEIFAPLPYFPALPDSVIIPFRLHHDGMAVLDIPKGKRVRSGHFTGLVYNELETWPFPRCDARRPAALRHVLKMPAP